MDKLTEKAAALLREGAATLVIGARLPHGVGGTLAPMAKAIFCRLDGKDAACWASRPGLRRECTAAEWKEFVITGARRGGHAGCSTQKASFTQRTCKDGHRNLFEE